MLNLFLWFCCRLLCLGLLPMRDVRTQLGELLAADATTLAPAANANEMILFMNNVNVNEDLVIGDLTPATFDGYAPIAGAIGAQESGFNPATGEQVITIKVPAGGYRWETTGVTNLPQTIYGFALTDSTGANLLGAELLTTPVVLNAVGQVIDLGAVKITFVLRPMA